MQTPETRIINQCTYTPVEVKVDNSKSLQPYLKLNLINTILNDKAVNHAVLAKLEAKVETKNTHPHFDNLKTAALSAWNGDITTSVQILRHLDTEEVISFAQSALETEKELFEQSQKDVETSIAAIAKREQTRQEAVMDVRQEMASLRDSILTEVREMVRTNSPAPTTATERRVAEQIGTTNPVTQISAIQTPLQSLVQAVPEIRLANLAVTTDLLHAELLQNFPETASFLQAAQFFPTSKVANVAPIPIQLFSVKTYLLQQKENTLKTLIKNMKVEPMGYLHLERLQFTPVGYERGELVYSLPLLPGETVRLTHREWSRTEKEFSEIVSTTLEQAAEEALSEKSELTEATNNQEQHSSAYNVSVSAGYSGVFSFSSSFGYNCNDSETKTRQSASKRSQEITKKASSRAKKEHKVSFKVTTTYEFEEQSYREITNKEATPVRWDFYRLMRKWQIDLYRTDVRLTYDIVIPEPGNYLLRKYILLEQLNKEIAKPYSFDLNPKIISRELPAQCQTKVKLTAPSADSKATDYTYSSAESPTSWVYLAKQYRVSLMPPPDEYKSFVFTAEAVYSGGQLNSTGYIDIDIPEGYEYYSCKCENGSINTLGEKGALGSLLTWEEKNVPLLTEHKQRTSFQWYYECRWIQVNNNDPPRGTSMHCLVDVTVKLTEEAFRAWQMQCYEKLVDAAKLQYESKQERLKKQRDELLAELNREDGLMLRKLEKEELMKGVLRWLLGPEVLNDRKCVKK